MSNQMQSTSKGAYLMLSLLFVTLYGSGFVGAKVGLPYVGPLTFLALRFSVTFVLLVIISMALRAQWPKSWRQVGHIAVSGLLLQAVFSAGVFVALELGVSPAISALIIALQPIVVGLAAGPLLGEKVGLVKWVGLLLGLIGVVFVVCGKAGLTHSYLIGVFMCVIGLAGLAAGNLYQKRFCSHMNIFTGGVIQAAAAAIAMWVLAPFFESMHVQWTYAFIFALFWMSVVVSIGALSILYVLIRNGEANKVASLFYLVPVAAGIIQYFVYGEVLSSVELIGMLVVVVGVALVNKR